MRGEKQEGQAHSISPSTMSSGPNGSGQALLEVLVALAIGLVIAAAFVTLGTYSVRNSTFSSNQARATQLGQEGIEALITIRDQNTPGAIQNFIHDQWSLLYQSGVLADCSPEEGNLLVSCNDFYLLEAPCSLPVGAPTPIPQRCIERRNVDYTSAVWRLTGDNAQFSRMIRITETGVPSEETTIKNVTVFVWWFDASGRHESVISRKIFVDRLE